jgi:hypothetical protein
VLSGSTTTASEVRLGQGTQLTITDDDAAAIEREIPRSRSQRRPVVARRKWWSGI